MEKFLKKVFSKVIDLYAIREETTYSITLRIKKFLLYFFTYCIVVNVITYINAVRISIIDIILDAILLFIASMIYLLPIGAIVVSIIKGITKNANKDSSFNGEYYRELPDDVKPAVIAYTMQGQKSDLSDISATILDLIRRGYLEIENNENINVKQMSEKSDVQNYVLKLKKVDNGLLDYEKYLVDWLCKYGDNKIIFSELKEKMENDTNAPLKMKRWKKLIEKEIDKNFFFGEKGNLTKVSKTMKKIALICLVIAIISFIALFVSDKYISFIESDVFDVGLMTFMIFTLVVCPSIAIFLYTLKPPEKYLKAQGALELKKWNGFRKFLKDYTLIEKRDLEEIHLWEEYLVYSVAFGKRTKLVKAMNECYGNNIVKENDKYIGNKYK